MSKFSVYCPDYLFPHEESSQIKKKTQEWSLRSRNSSRNHHSHFYLYYEKAVESKKNDLYKEALERGVVVYLPEISCGGRPTDIKLKVFRFKRSNLWSLAFEPKMK